MPCRVLAAACGFALTVGACALVASCDRGERAATGVAGSPTAPTYIDALSGTWDGTSTYWNAPFRMGMSLNGTTLSGKYVDQYDTGYISGTYAGGTTVLILVNFGDTGIAFDGEFDGPDRIKGVIRGGVLGRTFPFEMTRRP